VASLTLDMRIAMSRGAVNGWSIPATGCRAIWLSSPGDHPEIAIDARLNQSLPARWPPTGSVHGSHSRGKTVMHSDTSLPQTPRAFRNDRGRSRPRPGRTAAVVAARRWGQRRELPTDGIGSPAGGSAGSSIRIGASAPGRVRPSKGVPSGLNTMPIRSLAMGRIGLAWRG
jgi:hypothetical protein